VKRSRKPVKRSRKPVKRSRKPVKFKMSLLRDLARKSVKSIPKSQRLRRIVKPRGQLGKIINEKRIMNNLSYWYIDTRVPHWLLKLLRTYPSQPVLSDEITKNLLGNDRKISSSAKSKI